MVIALRLTHGNELGSNNSDLALFILLQMQKKDNKVCHLVSVNGICHLASQWPMAWASQPKEVCNGLQSS